MDFKDKYDQKLKKPTEKLMAVMSVREEKYALWLRSIIAMAVGFLGISVGLKNQTDFHQSKSLLLYWSWNLQLIFLILGILFGTIRLFGYIRILDDEKEIRIQNIIKQLHDEEVDLSSTLQMRKVYKVAEKICYLSFVFALICVSVVSFIKGCN